METVSQEQGGSYLETIAKDPELVAVIDKFKANDRYGGPVLFDYPRVGRIGATTLRYVGILADLKRLFGSLDGMRICEIGVGYGGQCRVIGAYYKPASYTLVDLPEPLALAQRYLGNFNMSAALEYKTMEQLVKQDYDYDLVISNYAYAELNRAVQDVYIDKIIKGAVRGYMLYNYITPGEFMTYSADDMARMIPGARVETVSYPTMIVHPLLLWGTNVSY